MVDSPRGSKGKKSKAKKTGVTKSLLKPLDFIKGKTHKSGVTRKSIDENRNQVGFGPVRMNGLTRPNILSVQSIKYNASGMLDIINFPSPIVYSTLNCILRLVLAMPVPVAEPETKKFQFDLPLKLATRRSRTSLPVPTRFDTIVSIQRSNTLPKQELRR